MNYTQKNEGILSKKWHLRFLNIKFSISHRSRLYTTIIPNPISGVTAFINAKKILNLIALNNNIAIQKKKEEKFLKISRCCSKFNKSVNINSTKKRKIKNPTLRHAPPPHSSFFFILPSRPKPSNSSVDSLATYLTNVSKSRAPL